MEAYTRFNRCVFQWERTLLQIVGHDILAGEKFERNIITFVVYGITTVFIVTIIYTFLFYDPLSKIFALLFLFLVAQCIVKLYHVRYVEDFQWLIYFIQNLYEIHIKTKSKDRLAYFHKFSFYTEILFKVLLTLYVLSVFTFLPYPIYMYFFKNEVVTMLPLYMPGVDETSFSGYIFLSVYQFVSLFFATLGVCGCDFVVALMIVSTLIFAKIISLEMQAIENDLEEKDSMVIVRGRFRNIILMHQEMIMYMKRVEKLTFIMFFGQVGTSSTSSVIILYVILMFRYIPVYGLLIGMLFQIFIACLLGNFIEITHDRIDEAALLLNFHQFQMKEQRLYQFFVKSCQRPALLTIGGLVPLNLTTCLTIFSRIYSITMIIYTMVGE